MDNRYDRLRHRLMDRWPRWPFRHIQAESDGPGAPAGFDFDQLARDMARGLSRREALRRMGAGLGGALLASLGFGALRPDRAEATTPANLAICLGACNQAASSCAQQCGQTTQTALTQAQQAYQTCLSHCAPGAGYFRCLAACQATRTQQVQLVLEQEVQCARGCSQSRSACGNGCSSNGDAIVAFCSALPAAQQSTCISSGAVGGGLYQACQGDATRLCQQPTGSFVCCAQANACCSGQCLDLTHDAANCGACENACPSGQSCIGGLCALVCPAGLILCNGVCVDLRSDPQNCGSCGKVCPGGAQCVNGACACPAPQIVCSGACVDPRSDPNNCCGCGNVCPSGSPCVDSQCVCPTGTTICSAGCLVCCPPNAGCVGPGVVEPSLGCACVCNTGYFPCGGTYDPGSGLTLNPAACCQVGTETCLNGLCIRLAPGGVG
jgi:hypothetical protein